MGRRQTVDEISDAARSTLVEGERVVEFGHCWGAQRKERLPLVLARRSQYLMVLTDRRLLLFTRRPGPVQAKDLVIGKRYETFKLDTVHRARPLLQLRVHATSGTRMVFEFRPSRRHIGDALAQRLEPRPPVAALAAGATPDTEPPTAPQQQTPAPAPAPPTTNGDDEVADPTFWGAPTRRT
jgi:hypothetical protein